MTANSILTKLGAQRREVGQAPGTEEELADNFGVFGYVRGVRDRAIMLEVRFRNGNVAAFGYAWLERAELDLSDGITLHFSGKTVRITGRHLNAEIRPNLRLFAAILQHRVPWIQELDQPSAIEAPRSATIIEAVVVS